MTTDITPISDLISQFRKIETKGAITPESLGYLLQRIVDDLASQGNAIILEEFRDKVSRLQSSFEALNLDFNQLLADVDSRIVELGAQLDGDLTRKITSQVSQSVEANISQRITTEVSEQIEGNVPKLDGEGKILTQYLPESDDDSLVYFSKVAKIASDISGSEVAQFNSSDDGCEVIFNAMNNRFILQCIDRSTGIATRKYYAKWLDMNRFGSLSSTSGVSPSKEKVFFCLSESVFYKFDDVMSGITSIPLSDSQKLSEQFGAMYKAQIGLTIRNGMLEVFGYKALTDAGYVPYLFRRTKRYSNKYTKPASGGQKVRTKGRSKKGWNLVGSYHTVTIRKGKVFFANCEHRLWHLPTTSYSADPATLITMKTHDKKGPCVAWGRSRIKLTNNKQPDKLRRVKLRFAIAFGKVIPHSKANITPANMVTNLAEFSIIYDTYKDVWKLAR